MRSGGEAVREEEGVAGDGETAAVAAVDPFLRPLVGVLTGVSGAGNNPSLCASEISASSSAADRVSGSPAWTRLVFSSRSIRLVASCKYVSIELKLARVSM